MPLPGVSEIFTTGTPFAFTVFMTMFSGETQVSFTRNVPMPKEMFA